MKPGHFLVAGLAAAAAAIGGEEPALWKVQKLICFKEVRRTDGLPGNAKKTIRTCVLRRAV
jgi:hypothetical protein